MAITVIDNIRLLPSTARDCHIPTSLVAMMISWLALNEHCDYQLHTLWATNNPVWDSSRVFAESHTLCTVWEPDL